MVQYIPRLKASLVLSFALVVGACSNKDDTAAADSALNADIQLANRDSAAQPALTDVPAAPATSPAPSASAPRPTTTTSRAVVSMPETSRLRPPLAHAPGLADSAGGAELDSPQGGSTRTMLEKPAKSEVLHPSSSARLLHAAD